MFTFEPMSPGKYKLHFRYDSPNSQMIGDHPRLDNAVMAAMEFEITD